MSHQRIARYTAAGAAAVLAVTSLGGTVLSSSHREAPLISQDRTADNTDVYAFVSPDKPDTVTLIANFNPGQRPDDGPNFFPFADDVRYFIKVDNSGDGVADVTFSFEFASQVANPDSFLYSGYGPIEDQSDPQGAPFAPANFTQTYAVSMNDAAIGTDLSVPPPNVGPRTTPDYGTYTNDGIHDLDDGLTVFAGNRDDPFFLDAGSIFDLGGLRPFNQAHLLPLKTADGQDGLSSFNVNSIAIQVPKAMLTSDGQDVSAPDADNAVIGVWAGAERQSMRVLSADGVPTTSGDWVQVSRLGNPLVNEVLIGLGQKDAWNAGKPADDAQFMDRYLSPELAAIINTVYPSLPDTRTSDRTDLVLILGQGVPTLNATNTGDTLYDMLRLNMGVPPTDKPERMGVIAGDLAGFPNGRRLTDDVVDIELRAIADGYGSFLNKNFDLPNLDPNNTVGDGCNRNDVEFLDEFPYLARPWQGYDPGVFENSPCEPVDRPADGANGSPTPDSTAKPDKSSKPDATPTASVEPTSTPTETEAPTPEPTTSPVASPVASPETSTSPAPSLEASSAP